jgi:hypothetical protein
LVCACGYRAPNQGGVYNLLPAALRAELYPVDRVVGVVAQSVRLLSVCTTLKGLVSK